MKRNIGVVVGLLVVVAVVVIVIRLKKGTQQKKEPTLVVELRPKPGDPDSIVDPLNGKMHFESNCVSCHGWLGEGDGPADPYLWRRPRNLADPSYMNSRSDEQFREILNSGGKSEKILLSRVMPAWNITFNSHQMQDIIAWVRRLHPTIEDFVGPGDHVRYEAVLPDARAEQVKARSGTDLAPDDHTVVFFAVFSNKAGRPLRLDGPAPAAGEANLSGYVAFVRFPVAEGQNVSLCMAISPEKKVHKVAVFEKVVLLNKGARDEASVDAFVKAFEGAGENIKDVKPPAIAGRDELCATLAGAAKRLYWRLLLALEQDKEDWEEIKAGKKPNGHLPGRAVWDRMDCTKCHGPTGKAKGPSVSDKEPLPTNMENGAYMNTLDDEYLMNMLRYGGIPLNISSTMPSYEGQMTEAEMKQLEEYMRSLAIPKK